MEYRQLGRTGLKVSVMGLGAGGPSRLGRRDGGNSEEEAANILRRGLDAGINFIDTAEAYGTEEIVGLALQGRARDSVIISTKKSIWADDFSPDKLAPGLEASLQRLGTDYVDVYHLHGVPANKYDYCVAELLPILQRLQQQGKVRFIGVTEAFNSDLEHTMLRRAVPDAHWDVVMVGHNLLNQTARAAVLEPALQNNIGILIMFAVRKALSSPERFKETVQDLVVKGEIDPAEIDPANPLGFVLDDGTATSIPDAAYRFCREEPGVHVVLSGTGNPAHLQANIASLERPPLPPATMEKIRSIFRNVTSITGE